MYVKAKSGINLQGILLDSETERPILSRVSSLAPTSCSADLRRIHPEYVIRCASKYWHSGNNNVNMHAIETFLLHTCKCNPTLGGSVMLWRRTCNQKVATSTPGCSTITYPVWASSLHTYASVTKQYNLVLAKGRWRSSAGKVTTGLAECNGSLPLDLARTNCIEIEISSRPQRSFEYRTALPLSIHL